MEQTGAMLEGIANDVGLRLLTCGTRGKRQGIHHLPAARGVSTVVSTRVSRVSNLPTKLVIPILIARLLM